MPRHLLVAALGLVVAGAVGVAAIRAYEGMAPHLSAANWRRWQRTEADLVRQCSYQRSQTAFVRRQEDRDMSELLSIARANNSATAPSLLSPQMPGVPMNGLVGYLGSELSCDRPELVAAAWGVAASLPGGYPVHLTAQQQVSFTRASHDFYDRCTRGPASRLRRDATIMVALNRAAPRADLLARLGVAKLQRSTDGGTTVPWFEMSECDHRAVAILARGVGATPSQIGG